MCCMLAVLQVAILRTDTGGCACLTLMPWPAQSLLQVSPALHMPSHVGAPLQSWRAFALSRQQYMSMQMVRPHTSP